jgi:hypothetical protein
VLFILFFFQAMLIKKNKKCFFFFCWQKQEMILFIPKCIYVLEKWTSLGKYLGISIVSRAPKKENLQYIMNQVEGKIKQFECKKIYRPAKRVTLTKSIIKVCPICLMMTMALPKDCINWIVKLQRSFIWGDYEYWEEASHCVLKYTATM